MRPLQCISILTLPHLAAAITTHTAAMILRLLSLALALLIATASAASPASITVYAWPLSASSPKPFAEISLPSTPDTGIVQVRSKKAVSATDGEIVRIGLLDANKAWSGVATSADSFKPGVTQKISLHTDGEGKVSHVSFSSFNRAPAQKGAVAEDLLVEVVPVQAGPVPVLNKPVVLNAEGKLDKPEEDNRSFMQKYAQLGWMRRETFVLTFVQVLVGAGNLLHHATGRARKGVGRPLMEQPQRNSDTTW